MDMGLGRESVSENVENEKQEDERHAYFSASREAIDPRKCLRMNISYMILQPHQHHQVLMCLSVVPILLVI